MTPVSIYFRMFLKLFYNITGYVIYSDFLVTGQVTHYVIIMHLFMNIM